MTEYKHLSPDLAVRPQVQLSEIGELDTRKNPSRLGP